MASNAKKELVEFKTRDGVGFGHELAKEFLFEEGWVNLNHGSFGTYPRPIRNVLRSFQDKSEARPDPFILYDTPQYLDQSREAMAKLLNTPSSTLVFVPNATTGVNTVLRNIDFQPGDHILIFSTIYGACEKTVQYLTETTPVKSVKVAYTYPVEDDWLIEEFRRKVKEVEDAGGRVKIAVYDTVVSMPGVRVPFERLTAVCKELGVMSCIDGAHGVGHVEIDMGKLDPDFFTSNCHKWLFVPRGCAIMHVAHRSQHLIRSTLPTSHGFIPTGEKFTSPFTKPSSTSIQQNTSAESAVPGVVEKSLFVANFEFVGTIDSTPYLCVPAALAYRQTLGGEQVIMEYCQRLAQEAGKHVARALGTEVLENSTNTLGQCCLSNVRLPISLDKVYELAARKGVEEEDVGVLVRDWMKKASMDYYHTFIMVFWYAGAWWTRLSAQVYLEMRDFETAARILRDMCARVEKGEWVG